MTDTPRGLESLSDAVASLRRDLKATGGFAAPAVLRKPASHQLGEGRPATLLDDESGAEIWVLDTLSTEEQLLAEAHELMHLLLEAEGLFAVRYDPDPNLAVAINNVVSHHHLVAQLEQRYGISSDLHLDTLRESMGHRETAVRQAMKSLAARPLWDRYDEQAFLFRIGLALLDTHLTCADAQVAVGSILGVSPAVRRSFEAAQRHLILPFPALDEPTQQARVRAFMSELGPGFYPDQVVPRRADNGV